MNKYKLLKLFSIAFIFCLLALSCENNLSNTQDKNTENDNNGQNNDSGNENNDNILNNQLHLVKGNIWYADSGSLFIEFPDNHLNLILFKNYQNFGNIGGNLNGNVTLGNFRISSYDGETMKLFDADNKEVAFSLIISENKLTVNGLNAIRVFNSSSYPYLSPRDFRSYNRTYTKGE